MSDFTQPLEQLGAQTRRLVELEVEQVKLQLVRGLSLSLKRLSVLLVLIGVGTALTLVLSFGLVLLLGELTGSYAWSAIGVAAVLGVVFAVLFVRRKQLFNDTFIPGLMDLFFPQDHA